MGPGDDLSSRCARRSSTARVATCVANSGTGVSADVRLRGRPQRVTEPGVAWPAIGAAAGENALYFALSVWFFSYMYRRSRQNGPVRPQRGVRANGRRARGNGAVYRREEGVELERLGQACLGTKLLGVNRPE